MLLTVFRVEMFQLEILRSFWKNDTGNRRCGTKIIEYAVDKRTHQKYLDITRSPSLTCHNCEDITGLVTIYTGADM